MTDDFNVNDGFDGYEEPSENDEFDGYEEPSENDEFDGYEEPSENDEFDGYEEPSESDEFDGYEESSEDDDCSGYEEPLRGDVYVASEKKTTSSFNIVSSILALAVVAAAVILIWIVAGKGLESLKVFSPATVEETLTLMDVGKELENIDRIGGNKLDEIIEACTLRIEENQRKELEASFVFDEVEAQKDLVEISLKLSSIVKDLKIKVVNDKDKLIANVPFEVEVKNPDGKTEVYKDENEDGIIYLDGIKGGEYSVKTLSIKGYENKYSFANANNHIAVKETLEYKKVDVSDEIKKDTEVDKGEDAGKKPALPEEPVDKPDEPGDKPEDPGDVTDNDPGAPSGQRFGIDVSKWNGDIDWAAVAASGVEYAIVRCGFRGSTEGGLIEDSKFYDNVKGASNNGIKVGVYFFSQAVNEKEAVEEASMVLQMVSGYNISYPIFLDVETSGGRGDRISAGERTAVCKAFCETIRSSGYVAGIYSNKTWFEEYINASELTAYKLWLAQYAKEVTYGRTKYDLWQYSDSGSVHGISTGVDLNISYLGY